MSRDSAKKEWKRSCVMRHILVFMDDTLRAILICLKGGGKVGSITYPRVEFDRHLAEKVERQLAEVKRWLDVALMQSGIDRRKGYALSSRERELINRKIGRLNRWAMEQKLELWREIVISLATINLFLFWARLTLGDTAHRRMVYIEADRLCLLLGDGRDWMLSSDQFSYCKPVFLDGAPNTGMRSEEEFFFQLLAMPCPRCATERATFEERGRVPEAAALLAM